MKISVIIPALNEAGRIERALGALLAGPDHGKRPAVEVIVADGGSTDGTAETARRLGAVVAASAPGRGLQMDSAARRASGDVLLFLHADTLLPAGWAGAVEEALGEPGTVAGGFTLSIDSERPVFRVVERLANLRSSLLGLIYGDQALFVRKDIFMASGGFLKLPLMEDVDCVNRLKRSGKVVLLDESVLTSPRRWEASGVVRNTLRNWLTLALYFLGVSPHRLYRLYYRGSP